MSAAWSSRLITPSGLAEARRQSSRRYSRHAEGSEFELIIDFRTTGAGCSGCQLDDRRSCKAEGDAMGPESAMNLSYAVLTIQKNDINGHFHAECVNGFARNNPQPVLRMQVGNSQETFTAFRAGGSKAHTLSDGKVAG
jgi:hypothetical protein